MQAAGEHIGGVGEDGGGAVALVHVAIDDGDAAGAAFGLHRQRGDGCVVEHAEARAEVAMRVVRAAGQVGGAGRIAFAIERAAAGGQRGARRTARAFDHRCTPRETDAPHLGGVQRAAGNAAQVAGVVGAEDLGVGGGVRDAEVVVGEQAAVVQARAQTRVLLHRKAVALGQGQHEMVGVVELQA